MEKEQLYILGKGSCHGLPQATDISFMGFNFSTIWIMVEARDLVKQCGVFPEEKARISIIVKALEIEELKSLMEYVYFENQSVEFNLCIDERGNKLLVERRNEWIEIFCLLMAHPLHIRVNGEIQIGFISDLSDSERMVRGNNFLSSLKTQGFKEMVLKDISETKTDFDPLVGVWHPDIANIRSPDKFYSLYYSALLSSDSQISIFILNNPLSVNTILSYIGYAEDKLFKYEKILFNCITKIHKKSEMLHKEISNKLRVEEELQTKDEYLNFILKKASYSEVTNEVEFSDIIKIKKFYHNEYEILPMWYKRFGHIIKVLTGKRTFRSLFDKNVKKYRE